MWNSCRERGRGSGGGASREGKAGKVRQVGHHIRKSAQEGLDERKTQTGAPLLATRLNRAAPLPHPTPIRSQLPQLGPPAQTPPI